MREVNWKAVPTCLKIGGAPVDIHWSFLLLIALDLALSKTAYEGWNVFWYKLILDGPILLLIVAAQEFAKAVTTFKVGGEVHRIVLWPLGGLTIFGGNDVRSDLKVVLAGIFSRIPLLIIFGAIFLIFKSEIHAQSLWDTQAYIEEIEAGFPELLVVACRKAFWYTAMLMCFHTTVPIFPLDGLRVWVGLMMAAGMTLQKAAKTSAIGGIIISVAFMIYGIVLVLLKYFAISEFALGAFGFVVSKMLYDMARFGRLGDDPVLGRPLYQNVSASTSPGNSGGEVEVPPNLRQNGTSVPISTAETTDIL